MIMGVGIDFGIQVITRFKEELMHYNPNRAMEKTLTKVIIPMATTTVAALIGFQAMTLGKLTIMGELGKIMSYGITSCFLVSITLIPAILVIINKKIYKKADEKISGGLK